MYTNVQGFRKGKKEIIRRKYPTISDKDLNFKEDKKKEIVELLEYELGRTKEELRNIIAAL